MELRLIFVEYQPLKGTNPLVKLDHRLNIKVLLDRYKSFLDLSVHFGNSFYSCVEFWHVMPAYATAEKCDQILKGVVRDLLYLQPERFYDGLWFQIVLKLFSITNIPDFFVSWSAENLLSESLFVIFSLSVRPLKNFKLKPC